MSTVWGWILSQSKAACHQKKQSYPPSCSCLDLSLSLNMGWCWWLKTDHTREISGFLRDQQAHLAPCEHLTKPQPAKFHQRAAGGIDTHHGSPCPVLKATAPVPGAGEQCPCFPTRSCVQGDAAGSKATNCTLATYTVRCACKVWTLDCWCAFKHPVDFICWWSIFTRQASCGVGFQCGEKRRAWGSSKKFFFLVKGAQRPTWAFLWISGSFGSGPRCIIIPWQNKGTYPFLWVKTILSLQWKAEIWTQLLFCSVQWITSDS